MFSLGSKVLLLFLLAFPCGFTSIDSVSADQESAENAEPDDALNEEEDDEEMAAEEDRMQRTEGDDDDSEADDKPLSSHSNVDTTILFTTGEEFPADKVVSFLVGFTNKGSEDFTVQSLETSLRYPQDFQFYIHNFTGYSMNTVVKPEAQASFEYAFIPPQPLAGRSFGLVILLNYIDTEGNMFQNSVYNKTVVITEQDDWLDLETMFMHVFLVGLVILMVFGMYQVLESRMKKRISLKVEKGTVGINDVDISWIPQETLNVMNKASPKTSPRKRTKRAAGTDQ